MTKIKSNLVPEYEKNPTALIVGSNGQDGYYLSHYLLKQGYKVIGLDKDFAVINLDIPVQNIDICHEAEVFNFVQQHQPQEIYYLAAYHRSSEMSSEDSVAEFQNSLKINVDGLLNFLSAIKSSTPLTKLFYAVSSHIFGDPVQVPQTELTPLNPLCPYGITKAAGMQICRYYRNTHSIFASCGILYNHESPKRSPQFVTRKIIQAAVKIKLGLSQDPIILGNLLAQTDWGAAEDYIIAMHQILSLQSPEDYIIASGKLHTIQEWVDAVFKILELNSADHIQINAALLQKIQRKNPLVGNTSKLTAHTSWQPIYTFESLIQRMVQSEIQLQTQLYSSSIRGSVHVTQ